MGRRKGSGAGQECHFYRHGGTGTRLHRIWKGMHRRCYDTKDRNYPKYGGAGITVCPQWRENFPAFREWSLRNGYRDSLTIDRLNSLEGYRPQNCRWTTRQEQNRNRRNVVRYEFQGLQLSLGEIAERSGLSYAVLKQRLRKLGWTLERAVSEPVHNCRPIHTNERFKGVRV